MQRFIDILFYCLYAVSAGYVFFALARLIGAKHKAEFDKWVVHGMISLVLYNCLILGFMLLSKV